MRSEIVELIPKATTYYRNQVQDGRGRWRDVSPEFRNLKSARDAAEVLSLESGEVRIMKYTEDESDG